MCSQDTRCRGETLWCVFFSCMHAVCVFHCTNFQQRLLLWTKSNSDYLQLKAPSRRGRQLTCDTNASLNNHSHTFSDSRGAKHTPQNISLIFAAADHATKQDDDRHSEAVGVGGGGGERRAFLAVLHHNCCTTAPHRDLTSASLFQVRHQQAKGSHYGGFEADWPLRK